MFDRGDNRGNRLIVKFYSEQIPQYPPQVLTFPDSYLWVDFLTCGWAFLPVGGLSYLWVDFLTCGWTFLPVGGLSYLWVDFLTCGWAFLPVGGLSYLWVGFLICGWTFLPVGGLSYLWVDFLPISIIEDPIVTVKVLFLSFVSKCKIGVSYVHLHTYPFLIINLIELWMVRVFCYDFYYNDCLG